MSAPILYPASRGLARPATGPRPRRCLVLVLGVVAALARPVNAELPRPRLDRIFPLGAEAGSVVTLEIQGRDLDDAKALRADHHGLRAEWIKEAQFRLTIAADVPPGVYDLRAVGKYGISAGRLFAVSRGLSEVVEKEPNDAAAQAEAVPLNVAINGASDGNGDDFFRFPARKGARVTIDAQAFRIDSTLRASLTLSTLGGEELARSRPYFNRTDPFLDVMIPADGEYLLRVHDATFSGGLPYRLIVSDRPFVENAFPCVVVPGETADLTIFGRNLPGGERAPGTEINGLPLDQATLPFAAPGDPAVRLGFAVLSPLPSSSLGARGLQARPKGLDDALNAVTLLSADAPVTREQEPNDAPDKAQALTLPTLVSARFDHPGDADWFAFTAKNGEAIALDLFCERLDLPGDPRVLVTDAKGQELASLDDHGIRSGSLDMFNRDPQGMFTAPADGTYRVLVQDTYGAGGPRFLYALRIGRAAPDFSPVVTHETPTDPSSPVVRRGGSAFLPLFVTRRDGFNGPVTVEAEDLPAGVSCSAVHVSPQAQSAPVVFTAASDAPEWAGAVRLRAWATIDGKRVERPVHASQRRWAIANISASRSTREITLAVRPTAPYGLKSPTAKSTVAAGGTLEVPVSVHRHWPEFRGKVQVNGLDLPPGFGVATAEIPEGKEEATVRVTIAANVPPGTYTIAFRGDAQVPFSPDPRATTRPNVRVADPSTPLTITVTDPAKK